MLQSAPADSPDGRRESHPTWLAYVAPLAAFVVLTPVESVFPRHYPLVYAAKILLVSLTLWLVRPVLREIRFDRRMLLPAILVGLAVFVEWIVVDKYVPYPHPKIGARAAFNPFDGFQTPIALVLFLAVRFYGLAVLVPIIEELFWRSFLPRYITRPEFETLPIGEFSWLGFGVMVVGFGAEHPEWLAAVICACAYGFLVKRTHSVFACVVAHAVTNLALGIYVLHYHAWRYW